MTAFEIVGWIGVGFGLLVAPPQLIEILTTGRTDGISVLTYIALCFALLCYLIYAVYRKDRVFIVAQSINLLVNAGILILLLTR